MALVVDQDVGLEQSKRPTGRAIEEFKNKNLLPLDPRGPYPGCVDILSPCRRLLAIGVQAVVREKLNNMISRRKPTSPNRSVSLFAFTNSLTLPFTIHSVTIANRLSVIVTPISGKTFGCRSAFHITTSLQNLYAHHSQLTKGHNGHGAPWETHSPYLFVVTALVHLQNLNRNIPAVQPAHPHVRKSTVTQRGSRSVIGSHDGQRSRNQSLTTTDLA